MNDRIKPSVESYDVIEKTAIAENLDRLEWFSILICHEENHIKYWQHIENP